MIELICIITICFFYSSLMALLIIIIFYTKLYILVFMFGMFLMLSILFLILFNINQALNNNTNLYNTMLVSDDQDELDKINIL